MPAPGPRLGLGTTIEFLTSGVLIEVTDSDWGGVSRTVHNVPHLGTAAPGATVLSNMPKLFGRLIDGGTFDIEGHFSGPALSLAKAAKEPIRVTLPLEDGQATPDIFLFTGGASNVKLPKLAPDEVAKVKLTIAIDGGITYTAAT